MKDDNNQLLKRVLSLKIQSNFPLHLSHILTVNFTAVIHDKHKF